MDAALTFTFILAGGVGDRLKPLTIHRCKPAVYFGGNFRVIDFTLMNCVYSGLPRIHLLTQYKKESLDEHCFRRWLPVANSTASRIETSPPKGTTYRGTADAVYKNLAYPREEKARCILVLSGDHIYHADYRRMISRHLESGADVTVLTGEVAGAEASSFGVVEIQKNNRITHFVEKPADPLPYSRNGKCSINLGVYCFSAEFLEKKLHADANDSASSHDFGKNILPSAILEGARILSCPLQHVSEKPYWRDIGTLRSFFDAHMDLLRKNSPFELANPSWPDHLPFRHWIPSNHHRRFSNGASPRNLVYRESAIEKARIQGCVVFPDVKIEAGADLERCILFPGAVVERNCKLRGVIIEEGARIPAASSIDAGPGGVMVIDGAIGKSQARAFHPFHPFHPALSRPAHSMASI